MCIGADERGGPKRCSAHARTDHEQTAAALAKAETQLSEAERSLVATRTDIDSLYREVGHERNPFYEVMDDERRFDGMTAEQRDDLVKLEAQSNRAAADALAATAAVDQARTAAQDAEQAYFETREGVGVLASRLDTESLEYACEDDPERRRALQTQIRHTMRRLSDTEQTMLTAQREREQRWAITPRPAVRGAPLGLGRTDKAALVVVGGRITGSYTNTRRADPDSQAGPDSPPDGGATLRCTRMSLVRRMADGSRRELVVPVETASGDDTGGPSVTESLRVAVRRADTYDDDYARWATAHHFAATPQPAGEWGGSRSYEEGRRAHAAARKTRDRLMKFLTAHEFRMIRNDLQAAAERV